MSIEALSYALNANVGDPTRKLILIGFANHAHKDGTEARPSVKTVAEYVGCSTRTIQRHISVLIADGFMREGDQRSVAHFPADRRPIVYDVAVTDAQVASWGTQEASGRRAQAAENGAVRRGDTLSPRERGDTGDADDVTPVTERRDTGVTLTIQEPSEEPSFSGLDSVKAKKPAVRSGEGTRLPEDFQASPEMIEWARKHAPLAGMVDHTRFCNYWWAKTGKDATKRDWVKTWQNWMLTEDERRQPTSAQQTFGGKTQATQSTTDKRVMDAQALRAKYETHPTTEPMLEIEP